MNNIRFTLVVVLSTCFLSFAADVAAQDLSREEIKQFKQLTAEGAKLYEDGEYEESIARLEQARQIYDHPDLAYNIGRAQAKLKYCTAARTTFEEYLTRPDLKPADVTAAKEQIDSLEKCTEYGTATFDCNVDATLVVDHGTPRRCGGEMELETGEHRAVVQAEGYKIAERTFDVPPRENVTVEIALEKLPPPPPAEPQHPAWQTYAGWSGIGVGGALLVTGFVIDLTSLQRGERMTSASANGDIDRVVELRDAGRRSRTAAIIAYSAGAVLAGAGVVLLLVDFGGESNDAAAVSLQASPLGTAATVNW